MATVMGDFREISLELVRDILELAENVEAGIAQPEHVTNKTEEFIEILGLISALSNQDIDGRVTANLHEVLQQSIAEQRQTHGTGRPAFDIPIDVLEHHVLCGLTAGEIATRFGVSERTIRRRMEQSGLRKTDLYSSVTDEELDRIVSEVHRSHPNSGYKLMHGFLNARGVRVPVSRLRESLRRVDAEGVNIRRLRLHVLRRRQYSVPGPNSLWHIDGNHKLIRWRFVVHGGTDGFSRLIVYRSVHNQRIERMWRDVYEHALDLFYQIFTSLEHQGTLNPDSEIHLYALHRVFLPHIQSNLDSFRDAWNSHGLRTERNQSPQQLWIRYRDQGPTEDPSEVSEDYGIDWNGPHTNHGGTTSVPDIQLGRELSDEELATLPVSGVSLTDAIESYLETVRILSRTIGD